jgi:hypothetical protein
MEAIVQEAEEDYYDDVIPVVDVYPANDDEGYHKDLIVNIDDNIIINDEENIIISNNPNEEQQQQQQVQVPLVVTMEQQ